MNTNVQNPDCLKLSPNYSDESKSEKEYEMAQTATETLQLTAQK